MTALRPTDAIPKWTKFVPSDSGRDPLGLAGLAGNLADTLMPGIVVTTHHARYYSLYTWIIWHVNETERPASVEQFVAAFQRREAAVAFGSVLRDAEAVGVIGRRAVDLQLGGGSAEDLSMAVQMLPANRLGGYGQYYAGSLYRVGLTYRPEGGIDRVVEGVGEELARAVQKVLAPTAWIQRELFRQPRIARDVLEQASERLSLATIRDPLAEDERRLLTDLFFGLGASDSKLPSTRRLSLARILHVVQSYSNAGVALGGEDAIPLREQLLFGPAYFGALMDPERGVAGPYSPPDFLKGPTARWRQLCAHEYLAWALERIFAAILTAAGDSVTGIPVEDLLTRFVDATFTDDLQEMLGAKARTPAELMRALGVSKTPRNDGCAGSRTTLSLSHALNEHTLEMPEHEGPTPGQLLAPAVVNLAILYAKWRCASDDEGWNEIRRSSHSELTIATVLPALDGWLDPNCDWKTATRKLVEALVLQHDRVMYSKGRLDVSWLRTDGPRLIREQDYSPGWPAHATRQSQAVEIMLDLKLLEEDAAKILRVTAEGVDVLSRVEALCR